MAEIFGANISTGTGNGAAQVFDTSKTDAMVQRQLEQQRKAQELENQQIAANIAKIKLDGVREADSKAISQKYNDTFSNFRALKIAQARGDKAGVIKAQSDLDRSQAEVMDMINQSKAENKSRAVITQDQLTNKKDYVRGSWPTWQSSDAISTFDPKYKEAADVSKLQRTPAKVDLADQFYKLGQESVVKQDPSVVKAGGTKFDQSSTKLDYNSLANRVKLKAATDQDVEDRINEVYDPTSFPQDRKDALEKAVGKPLNTAIDLASADAYAMNKAHLEQTTRKQLTEKTPKAGATIMNFAGVDQPRDNQVLSVSTPYKLTNGMTKLVPGTATASDNFQFPSIKLSTTGGPDLINAKTGKPVNQPGSLDIYGSQMTVVPVWKQGAKNKSGENMGGLVVSDQDKEDALSHGNATYKLMFHGNHGNVVGLDAQGEPIYSKDPTPVYVPASNSALTTLQLKTPRDKQAAVGAKISQMVSKASMLNAKIPKSNSDKPVSLPKIKISKTQKLDF